jgi:25S rRNA (uracil2843-N3)-methyltransferase
MVGKTKAPPPLLARWHKQAKAAAKAAARSSNTNSKKQEPKKTQDEQDQEDQKQKISEHDRKHQQRILDVFRHTFDHVLSSPSLTTTLQSVKQALFDRDFAKAFGDPEHLAVYAARWSPTRALCYASVLSGIWEHLEPLSCSSSPEENGDEGSITSTDSSHQLKVLSIGGGAAELVMLGAFLTQHPSTNSDPQSGTITLLDSAPWATVVSQLTTALTTPPPLSKYASAAAKLSNAAMVPPSSLTPIFLQHDALTLPQERLTSLVGTDPLLITLFFTLNELFTASGIGKTSAFLLNLTSTLPFGSLLLVVDSPGSYSETSVGKEAKRYPMQWLLDRIMLGTQREPVNGRRWAKLETQESVWFRLAETLEYPIPLENMRYQMHLYRAEDASLVEKDEEED